MDGGGRELVLVRALVSAVPAQPIRIPAQARTNGSRRNVAVSLESPPIAVTARNLGICAPLIAAAVPRGDEAEFRRRRSGVDVARQARACVPDEYCTCEGQPDH